MNQNQSDGFVVTKMYCALACSLVRRAFLAAVGFAAMAAPALAANTPPTIANNTFASTPVGQSLTQTVTLTLNTASAIKSIALATGTAASTEYKLNGVTVCTVDGATVNNSGTVCSLSITYTPLFAGTLASPRLSRTAQLLYTDASSNVTAYGLSGAATKAVPAIAPGTLSVYAGLPYTAAGVSSLDNGLGPVTGGYAGNGVAATSATFGFAPYNAIFAQDQAANATQPMALDSQGNLYVIDLPNYVIRKIDNSAQHLVTTIAGTPQSQGYTGNGGLATSAKLNNPHAITLDAAGNIYFLDTPTGISLYNGPPQVVRRIDAVTGIITAIYGQNFTGTYDATDGGGTCNLSVSFVPAVYACGDGGQASYAYLLNPYSVALDGSGNLYLWSGGYGQTPALRRINSAGVITTIATGTTLNSTESYGGMTLGSDGNLYVIVVDMTANAVEIKQLNPTTLAVTAIQGTNASSFGNPYCYLAQEQGGIPAANFQIEAGTSSPGNDLSSDAGGNVYVSGNFCTAGESNSGTPGIARINVAAQKAYAEVVANGYPAPGTATSNYNAYYNYAIAPVTAIPDSAGNIYFTSYNQIALLSGSNAQLTFGTQNDFTTSAAMTATYANLGNGSAAAPAYTLASGANFVVSEKSDTSACDALGSIAGGATCNLDVAFAPVAVGPLNDVLNVSGAGTTEKVNVSGTGYAEPQFAISPATLAFGNQVVNTTSPPMAFTLSNTGTANLIIESMYPDGTNGFTNYAVVANGGTCLTTGQTTLTPGQSCTVQVTFKPTSTTSLPANFYVATNINFGDVATLTGTGVPAVTTAPVASLAPTAVVFTNTAIGAKLLSTVVLSNTGTATLTGILPTITGTNASQFSVDTTSTCGATLAAGSSCNIVIDFKPTLLGLLTATLSVADNAAGSPQTATLSGTGTPTPVAQLQFAPSQLSVIAGTGTGSANDTGDGGPAISATFNAPIAVTQDASGNIYVSDQGDNYVRKFTIGGNISAFAGVPSSGPGSFSGDTGQATSANLAQPIGLALDASGSVYIADYSNSRIRKVVPSTGVITTYAGIGNGFFTGANAPNTVIPGPEGACFDPGGNLYIASTNASLIIKITPAGATSIFAGLLNTGGTGTAGYNGDNIAANQAEVNFPNTVACDQAGNVYIADTNNNRVRKVTAGTGIITTVAGNGTAGSTGDSGPATTAEIYAWAVATDLAGDVFITSTAAGTNGATVRKVDLNGTISTVAGGGTSGSGGPATAMKFGGLGYTGVDNNGSLLIPSFSYANSTDQVFLAGPNGFLQFGTVTVASTSQAQTVTFENTGNAVLTLSQTSYAATAPFTVIGGTCQGLTTLALGATCNLTVTFTPTSATTFNGTISVKSNGTITSATINLQGTGMAPATAPVAALSPAITFPNTVQGHTATAMSTTLSNTGTAALTITNVALSDNADFSITANTCGNSLAAGSSCTISVNFTPSGATTYNATLTVTDNSATPTQFVAVTGTGLAATPSATLTGITFQNQAVGTSTTLSSVVSNSGTGTLNISNTTVSGTGFTLATGGTCGTTLNAGSSCSINVTFSPVAAINYTGSITLTDNATGSPQTAPLSGTGTAPQANLSPSTIAFPGTTVGNSATAQIISLSNPGNATLTITNVTLGGANPGDFAITANSCGNSLAISATCTISVTFTPASVASFTATVNVTDNATGSPQSVTLTGTGTAVPLPQAVLTPTNVAFAATAVGSTTAAQNITLSNPGNAALTITGVTISGANPSDFAITTNSCGNSLAVSATCTISVTFTPASATTFAATLSVADNASGSPQSATLSGTGTSSVANFSLAGTPQSLTVSGGSIAQFTITGTGLGGSFTNPITLSVSGLPAGTTSSFAPASITPGGTGASSVLSIQTLPDFVLSTSPPMPGMKNSTPLLALLLLPLLGVRRIRKRLAKLPRTTALLLLAACCGMLGLAGCGGGYNAPLPHTYALTVSGQSGTTVNTTTVSLTIQ